MASGCRKGFLSEVFSIQAKTTTNLFTTSRPILDNEKEFRGCLSLEILPSNEDIGRYLDSHMSQLPTFVFSKPKLQEEIKTEILKAVKGCKYIADYTKELLLLILSEVSLSTALSWLA